MILLNKGELIIKNEEANYNKTYKYISDDDRQISK